MIDGMKGLLTALFLALLIGSAAAQDNFFKKYPGTSSSCSYGLAVSADGVPGLAGLQFDSAGSRLIVHSRMGQDGSATILHSFGTGNPDDTISAIASASDGGFVLVATTGSASAMRDLLAFKVRANGTIAWRKRIGTASNDIVYRIARIPGGFALAGAATTGSNTDALVIKINEAGTILWKRTYGDAETELGHSIEPTGDGGLVVGGLREDSPFVWKLDSSGRIFWGRVLPDLMFSREGRVSVVVAGASYYLVGTSNRGGHSHGGPEHTGISVTRLGSAGEWIWTREYHSSDPAVTWRAAAAADGNVVIGGYVGQQTAKALVFELTPEGRIAWKRAYPAENSSVFDVVPMSDGGVLAAGCAGNERLEMFLARTDPRGNIPKACGRWKSLSLATDILQGESAAFKPAERTYSGSATFSPISIRKSNLSARDLCAGSSLREIPAPR
jgi:hypothetical protein